MWFSQKKENNDNINMDDFNIVIEDSPEFVNVDEYGIPTFAEDEDLTTININTDKESEIEKYDEFDVNIESEIEKYDEFGRRKIEINTKTIDDESKDNPFGIDTEISEIVEFGVIEFNKSYIETTNKWEVEKKNPGAFFLYRCNEDILQKTLCLKNKETNEVIWTSPIILAPEQIVIENKKSNEVYMSHKVLTLDNVTNLNDTYVLYTEDEEIIQDFEIIERKSKAEDIVVKYDNNKSTYIINHMLKYAPINIEVTNEEIDYEIEDASIIIEKIGDKYTVLLNHLDGVLSRSLYLVNGENKYFEYESDLEDFLEKIKNRLNIMYQLSEEEFNEFSKLIIVDEIDNTDLSHYGNINIVNRKEVILNIISKQKTPIIDVNELSLEVCFYNENNEYIRINTSALGLNKLEKTIEEIEKLSLYIENDDIIVLGLNEENNSIEEIITLTELITK